MDGLNPRQHYPVAETTTIRKHDLLQQRWCNYEKGVTGLDSRSHLNQNQFVPLVDFAHTTHRRKKALEGTTLLKKLNAGDFAGLRLSSKWGGTVGSRCYDQVWCKHLGSRAHVLSGGIFPAALAVRIDAVILTVLNTSSM